MLIKYVECHIFLTSSRVVYTPTVLLTSAFSAENIVDIVFPATDITVLMTDFIDIVCHNILRFLAMK